MQPPDAQSAPPPKRNLLFLLFVAFTLFVLFDLAVLGYFFLVDTNETPRPPVQQEHSEGKRVEPANEPSVSVQNDVDPATRTWAETLRERWMNLEAMAEADAVRSWAESDYAAIVQTADEGEEFLARGEYQSAGDRFQQAVRALETLQGERPTRLAQALERGGEALASENGRDAVWAFTRALALSPGNAQAERGLARARNLDQVLALYREGLALEKQGGLQDAEALYRQARERDPEFQSAARALARVQAQLEEKAFQQAMGGFLQALAAQDVQKAKNELSRAARLRPQSTVVLNGRKQMEQLARQQTLARLQREYMELVAAERWLQARKRCEQALKIDPQAAFAVNGLQRVVRRLELDQALQAILAAPLRLQEDGPLQEARQTLAVAESVPGAGPRLTGQVSSLRELLDSVTRKVLVVVQSDNATDVVIYRVGRLGRFERRELQLRPGRYTAVGSRPGYRDVRREFEIKPGTRQATLRIRCEEVI